MKNSTPAIITLTTDFGINDAYVAAMKGAILSINPGVTLIDITHNIPPQDVHLAAFLLHTTHTFFPDGTIHLAVVDPGVGTSRRPIALIAGRTIFVAPDNGLLSYILSERIHPAQITGVGHGLQEMKLPSGIKAFHLNNPAYWRHPVSKTFHGRDIFAPVAAHLSLGVPPEKMGKPISSLLAFPITHPQTRSDGSLVGHIQHIDSFGNLISDVRERDLPMEKTETEIEIRGQKITGLSSSYDEGKGFVALMGSSGYLEIAFKNGSAAKRLAAKEGDSLILKHK